MSSSTIISSISSFHSSSSISPPRVAFPSHVPPTHVSFRHPRRPISAVSSTVDTPPTATAITQTKSFYDVLGIQDGATCKEIKAAYRKLARSVHPDAAAINGRGDATSAGDEFIRVHEAYATLSDPRKRADYDKMLFFKRRRVGYSPNYAVSSTGFSGHTRRTWETDQCW